MYRRIQPVEIEQDEYIDWILLMEEDNSVLKKIEDKDK